MQHTSKSPDFVVQMITVIFQRVSLFLYVFNRLENKDNSCADVQILTMARL